MNLDNDFDNDGNNIVPCNICGSNYCPRKEGGKCPEEDMFALEGEIRMLLDEYKATDDDSRIANVLEAVEKLLQTERQKRKEMVEAERDMKNNLKKIKREWRKQSRTRLYKSAKEGAGMILGATALMLALWLFVWILFFAFPNGGSLAFIN